MLGVCEVEGRGEEAVGWGVGCAVGWGWVDGLS